MTLNVTLTKGLTEEKKNSLVDEHKRSKSFLRSLKGTLEREIQILYSSAENSSNPSEVMKLLGEAKGLNRIITWINV